MSHMVVEEFVSPCVNQKDKLHDTRNGGGGSRTLATSWNWFDLEKFGWNYIHITISYKKIKHDFVKDGKFHLRLLWENDAAMVHFLRKQEEKDKLSIHSEVYWSQQIQKYILENMFILWKNHRRRTRFFREQ